MKKPVTVGIAGFGYWGPNLVRNFRSIAECRLKTVCDLSEKRLKDMRSLYPEVAGETEFDRLVQDAEIDAIVIATSARLHYKMAKASLTAGKHVLIEKPMACSTEECEDLIALAKQQGKVVMVGHTFLYSAAVRKIKEIVDNRDLGDLRYIAARRLNLGLFQKDINVAWDLAPHDISIILHIMQELPHSVNCRGGASITNGIEDMTSMSLHFTKERSAIIHSSWHDPRKVREMTIVGSKRMIVYDDIAPLEKIKVYDVRVERPPHYNTFAEFQYAYHYGDTYSPFIKHDEPLKTECQHFIECINENLIPLTSGATGLEVVRILEASSKSLKQQGAPVTLWSGSSTPFPMFPNRGRSSSNSNGGPTAPILGRADEERSFQPNGNSAATDSSPNGAGSPSKRSPSA